MFFFSCEGHLSQFQKTIRKEYLGDLMIPGIGRGVRKYFPKCNTSMNEHPWWSLYIVNPKKSNTTSDTAFYTSLKWVKQWKLDSTKKSIDTKNRQLTKFNGCCCNWVFILSPIRTPFWRFLEHWFGLSFLFSWIWITL